jgi:Replication-relaxation
MRRAWGPVSGRVAGSMSGNTAHQPGFGDERKENMECAVRGGATTHAYLSAVGVVQLRQRLSGRDMALIRQVAELRLMSARQVQALHFPAEGHVGEAAATRARQRVVARLVRERLLSSLTRRVGGVRAGSMGLVLALGPVGQRVLALEGPRRRAYEPTYRFVDHTLAIAQLVVDVTLAGRRGLLDVLALEAEPACWRDFSGLGGRRTLRPDAFLSLGVGEYELRWFIEVDRATESLPTVIRKCQLYAEYYQSGIEQAKPDSGGVFPRVCWVVPDEVRAEQLVAAVGRERSLPGGLFVVVTTERAVGTLTAKEAIYVNNEKEVTL